MNYSYNALSTPTKITDHTLLFASTQQIDDKNHEQRLCIYRTYINKTPHKYHIHITHTDLTPYATQITYVYYAHTHLNFIKKIHTANTHVLHKPCTNRLNNKNHVRQDLTPKQTIDAVHKCT